MHQLDKLILQFLDHPANILGANLLLIAGFFLFLYRRQVGLVVKSLRRNIVRTLLTGLATMVFVFVVTLVWTILAALDAATTEKSKDLKAIVTERWQLPSQMPFSYAGTLADGGAAQSGDVRPVDSMTWQFFGGTIDPTKRTRDNMVFFFAMDPAKVLPMMDGVDEFTAEEVARINWAVDEIQKDKRKVLVGPERLAAMKKRVGDTIKVTSINYKDIDLEFEIIGELPKGRYGQSAVMHRDYLNDTLDAWPRTHGGKAHDMALKTLNLVWLKVPDTQAFQRLSDQILSSPLYTTPAVKCETASSGIASFLDAYRDFLWGIRWLLVPAILATMSLVIANAISISVRERRTEMAVLKVLGFGPTQIMLMVLGEALVIGAGSGFLSAAVTYVAVNAQGGLPFQIAFFPAFRVPLAALWWGPMLGGLTALAGSIAPSWSARSVKVAEEFSKIS
jgi:putative ABC transport system permease protein